MKLSEQIYVQIKQSLIIEVIPELNKLSEEERMLVFTRELNNRIKKELKEIEDQIHEKLQEFIKDYYKITK